MLALGNTVVLDDAPDTELQVNVESTSAIVMVVPFRGVSSFVDLSVTSAIVGVSLTGFTVRTKVSVLFNVPSVTVKVTVADPF